MRRGDLVTVALQGDHGKPRPALIVQSDLMEGSSHVAILLLTSLPTETPMLRVRIDAAPGTGLAVTSFTMLDRITTAPRNKLGMVIGRVDDETMLIVNRVLALFLGLA